MIFEDSEEENGKERPPYILDISDDHFISLETEQKEAGLELPKNHQFFESQARVGEASCLSESVASFEISPSQKEGYGRFFHSFPELFEAQARKEKEVALSKLPRSV